MDALTDEQFLVTTEWLADHLDHPQVRVIDVSGHLDSDRVNRAHDAYLEAHIPGAQWFDVASSHGELSDPSAALPWTWPPLSQIDAAMQRIGVSNSTVVVITARSFTKPYGHGTMWATRTWWTLHHSGVHCVILEGGVERWLDQGRPVQSGPVSVPPGSFTGTDRRVDGIADQDDVKAALVDEAACVIDALPPESFSGERINYARPGHITGAQNVPFHSFIESATADFVAVDEARAILEAAGVMQRERAVLY